MKFENQAAFEELISSNGLNLFLGAGFSVMSYNKDDEKLMLGFELNSYLINHFELEKYKSFPLPKIANHLKRTRKSDLFYILKTKYTVNNFDDKYKCIPRLPIKNIFTTNIDNLCEKIYDTAVDNYLSDVDVYGYIESPGVNLYKLHGSVTYTYDKELLFSSNELSGAFLRDSAFWNTVSLKIAAYPTLFWGTNLEDPNIIDLLNPDTIKNRPHSPRWIVILPGDKNDLVAEEYSSEGYRIIRATTQDMLSYLGSFSLVKKEVSRPTGVDYSKIFPKNHIQTIIKLGFPSRAISTFYQGDEPVWSDICSGKLIKISAYINALDRAVNKENTLLIGSPGSGKTTLLMQLAVSTEITGTKFFFDSIDPDQATFLATKISKEKHVYIFLDNLGDNIDAYNILKSNSNIIFVSADRDLRYESIKHKAKIKKEEIIDISDLSRADMQKICDNMEKPLPRNYDERTSLFELCYSVWAEGTLSNRIVTLIDQLTETSKDLLEFYTLMTYVRYTGIFASMDMLLCYYSENDAVGYEAIYDFQNKIYSLIDGGSPYRDFEQDYFSLRSRAFCEASLRHLPANMLNKVLSHFHNSVHRGLIRRYDIFRRKAFDADITTKAFPKKDDGKKFYEHLLSTDNSAFVRHQYALYLWRKGDVDAAWAEIDSAYTTSNGKVYSINNSHAFILFDTNINKDPDEKGILVETLQKSFDVLENCLKFDKRKSYHIITYAKQAIQYYIKFYDDISLKYITKAYQLITAELSKDQYIPKPIYKQFIYLKEEIESTKIKKSQQGV